MIASLPHLPGREREPRAPSQRFAVLDIAPPILAEAVQLLANHGVEFVSSVDGPAQGGIRLVVAGDMLPDDCDRMPCLIEVVVEQVRIGPFVTSHITGFRVVRELPRGGGGGKG